MNSIHLKVFHDFWYSRTRTALVIIAIALGVAAFCAVLSSYAILTRELDRGYLDTNPASAILRTDRIDDGLIAAILANKEVSAAEPRRVVSGQLKAGPAQWRNLLLFVVNDYGNIEISKLGPQAGAWPPKTGEILIERDALQVAQTSIGNAVSVKTSNGVEYPLLVSGSVHDVGQAQARMENIVYGYITLDTLKLLGEEPYLNQLNIVVQNERFNPKHIDEVAQQAKQTMEERGHPVTRIDIPTPGKHPHSALMGLLLLAMSSFGIFVLILSGILVVNFLTALMAAQKRQIGVMKALGGTRSQIAGIYLAQALLMGAAAVVVAIPFGLWGARMLCRYMAGFLNFDINSFSVPLWVYLLVGLVGLLAPVLAALYPAMRGSSVSVRAALTDFGVGRDHFGRSSIDRALTHLGAFSLPLTMAVRNSFRRRARFALTMLTLAVGGIFFMSALNVRSSMVRTLDRLFDSRKFDLSVGLNGTYSTDKIDRAVNKTRSIITAEGWLQRQSSLISADNQSAETAAAGLHNEGDNDNRVMLIALPANSKLLHFDLADGRSFTAGDTGVVVVNSSLAIKLAGKAVGQNLTLQTGSDVGSWKVIGVARESFSPPVAYIPIESLTSVPQTLVNSLRLQLTNPNDDTVAQVKSDLDKALNAEGVRAVGSATKTDSRFGFDQHMLMIYIFLIISSGIIALVGGLGLMTTTTLNVLERHRELGVLRALGARSATIWIIVAVEALVIGLASWILSTLLAWPVSKAIGNAMVQALFTGGLEFTFDWRGVVIWFVISVLVSLIGSSLPAWRASRLTVREALAYE